MADKNKIVKVMEFVKIGFKVLQDIILEVLSLDTAPFKIKSKRNCIKQINSCANMPSLFIMPQ